MTLTKIIAQAKELKKEIVKLDNTCPYPVTDSSETGALRRKVTELCKSLQTYRREVK